MYCLYVNCLFFALFGARSQEFHSPRHLCCGWCDNKSDCDVIWTFENCPSCGREEQTTDTVGVASGSERLFLLNRNNKIVSKGDEVSKNKQGNLVSSLCCAGCEGWRVQEGRVQVRGGSSGGRTRSPTSGPVHEGRRPSGSGFILLLPCGAFRDYTARHPGPSASRGCGSSSGPRVRQLAPSAASIPSTLPSWTHEDTSVHAEEETGLQRRGALGIYSGGDEAPFTSGVCLITTPQPGCFSAPPLSHTHSRRAPGEGRRIRDGEMLIIRGEATDSSQSRHWKEKSQMRSL